MGQTRGDMESPSANGKYKEEDRYPSLLDTAEGQLRGVTHTISEFPSGTDPRCLQLYPAPPRTLCWLSPLPCLPSPPPPLLPGTHLHPDPGLQGCFWEQQLRALLESLIFSKLFKRQLLHLRMRVVAGPNNDGAYAWSITACSH